MDTIYSQNPWKRFRNFRSKHLLLTALLIPACLALIVVYNPQHPFKLSSTQRLPAETLWLNDYQVDIDALEVSGVTHNLSGITWNTLSQTLFAVINGLNHIVELSPEGLLIRTIVLNGFKDVEAITWMGGNQFLVVDERRQSIHQITIDSSTHEIFFEQTPQITVGIQSGKNKGFEGIAWNPLNNQAFVVKERDPMMLYEVRGFNENGLGNNIIINTTDTLNRTLSRSKDDLSGLHYHQLSGHLLVLSDETKRLTALSHDGQIISQMDLRTDAHNLKESVPQPEGVTMDDKGNIYIVSEPNLFYRFNKTNSG
ncbi:SdiA-regulated domain-containing protein [Endozoicomonas numazuensis]|uniref:SdiA-regulated domain-containing protein n=1 Tax=Endozoicomonas numazuensis TaxID=1137799 RepID=UPI00068E1B99|nr:SdiA-regulated domain-containing protein [Endozoicomonas numazuensis]